MARLQDAVEPFGYEEVERIVTSELDVGLQTRSRSSTTRRCPTCRSGVVRDMEVVGETIGMVDAY